MPQERRESHQRPQPELFDQEKPIALPETNKTELVKLLETLLAEIVATPAIREAGDEQDQR